MSQAPGFLGALVEAFDASGVDLRAWGLAWARVAPTVALVPAFGLRAVPASVRAALGLALAAGVAPALVPVAASSTPWPVLLLGEAAKGLPVAISAAGALWIATMAGGAVDNLRAAREQVSLPNVEPGASPTGALLSMLVAISFLESGGPARVAAALADPGRGFSAPLLRATIDLAHGVDLAVAVAAPVLVASIIVEVAGALVARAASPAFIQSLIAPLRAVVILGITALVFDRMAGLVALLARGAP